LSQKLYLILINAPDKMNQQDQMNESPITCIEIESFINHFEVNLVSRIQEEATQQVSPEEEDTSEWTHVGFRQDISNLQKDSNWEIKEILLAMKKREDRLYLFKNYVYAEQGVEDLADQGMIPTAWREALCLWIEQCVIEWNLSPSVEPLTVNFMDRLLASLPPSRRIDTSTCFMCTVTALHLAQRLMHQNLPYKNLLLLVNLQHEKLVTPEGLPLQDAIIRNLRFALHPPLAHEYLEAFNILLQGFNCKKSMYLHPRASASLRDQACSLIESAWHISDFVPYAQHTLAFVALITLMEYTFMSNQDNEHSASHVCLEFMKELGSLMDLPVLLDIQDEMSSNWTFSAHHNAQDVRIIRILLWKILLDQPTVAAQLLLVQDQKIDMTSCPSACSSPQSVIECSKPEPKSETKWWENYIDHCKTMLCSSIASSQHLSIQDGNASN